VRAIPNRRIWLYGVRVWTNYRRDLVRGYQKRHRGYPNQKNVEGSQNLKMVEGSKIALRANNYLPFIFTALSVH